MRKTSLLILSAALVSTTAFAASFDCDKATTFIEKAICNNEKIGKLDDELAVNFKTVKNSIGGDAAKELIASQKQWLSVRNKCTDDQCLIDSYSKRIDVIAGHLSDSNISSSSDIKCAEVKYGAESYFDKMEQLSKKAKLSSEGLFSRHHEEIVSILCENGKAKDIDDIVNSGQVKPTDPEAIASVLGKKYKAKTHSEFKYTKAMFIGMGLPEQYADGVAWHYTNRPNDPCGKLAKQALSGNQKAIDTITKEDDLPSDCAQPD
ncbi:MAG: hypothetical protein WCL34_12615 [Methylococcaceae bacterium]